MKLRDLKKRLEAAGWFAIREGHSHTIYGRDDTPNRVAVPRHREIAEHTAHVILKQAGIAEA